MMQQSDIFMITKEIAAAYGLPMSIAFLGAIVRMMFSDERVTIWTMIRNLAVGILVGVVASISLRDASPPVIAVASSVSGIVSIDIVRAVIKAGGEIRRDPMAALALLIHRGRKK